MSLKRTSKQAPSTLSRWKRKRANANNGERVSYKAPTYCSMARTEKGEWKWGAKYNLPSKPKSVPINKPFGE